MPDIAATPETAKATMQFTVPAVADAVAAAIGDRDLIIQGDKR